MTSRLKLLLLLCAIGVACKSPVTSSPPPPQSPPPPPPPPNHAPVAVIGGPYTSSTDTVLFDGSKSSDPDGDAITFSWTFGDGTTGDVATVKHVYQADGNYNVSLVVSDSKGAKDTATTTATIAVAAAPVLVGAGNIASGSGISAQTAALLDQIDGTVFTTGDNAFPDGTDSAYAKYYADTWGRFLARTRPTLGNHDYQDPNAKGSFDYFGSKLGPTAGLGYYSYDLGTWHVIVLNDKGGTDRTYPSLDPNQMLWLQSDLEAHKSVKCTIAMWHIPLFNSSNTPGWVESPDHKPIWDVLYQYGVDVVLNGQQHNYERFAPMDPSGNLDSLTGIREFNVGTGGESVDNFTVAINPHSEVRAAVFGVLKLTLKTDSYDWQFVPVPGSTFTDSGSGKCH